MIQKSLVIYHKWKTNVFGSNSTFYKERSKVFFLENLFVHLMCILKASDPLRPLLRAVTVYLLPTGLFYRGMRICL